MTQYDLKMWKLNLFKLGPCIHLWPSLLRGSLPWRMECQEMPIRRGKGTKRAILTPKNRESKSMEEPMSKWSQIHKWRRYWEAKSMSLMRLFEKGISLMTNIDCSVKENHILVPLRGGIFVAKNVILTIAKPTGQSKVQRCMVLQA